MSFASVEEAQQAKQIALAEAQRNYAERERAEGKTRSQHQQDLNRIEQNYNQAIGQLSRAQQQQRANEELRRSNASPAAKAQAQKNWNPTSFNRTSITELASRYDAKYKSQAEGARLSSAKTAQSDAVTFRSNLQKTVIDFDKDRDKFGTKVTPLGQSSSFVTKPDTITVATKKKPQVYPSSFFRDSPDYVAPKGIEGTNTIESDRAVLTFQETQQQQKDLFAAVTSATSGKEAIKARDRFQSENPYVGTRNDLIYKGNTIESRGVLIEKKLVSPKQETKVEEPQQFSKQISPFLVTEPKPIETKPKQEFQGAQRPTYYIPPTRISDTKSGARTPVFGFSLPPLFANEGKPSDVLEGFGETLYQRGYILGKTFPHAVYEEITVGFGAGEKRLATDTAELKKQFKTEPALDSIMAGKLPEGSNKKISGSIFADALLLGIPAGASKAFKPTVRPSTQASVAKPVTSQTNLPPPTVKNSFKPVESYNAMTTTKVSLGAGTVRKAPEFTSTKVSLGVGVGKEVKRPSSFKKSSVSLGRGAGSPPPSSSSSGGSSRIVSYSDSGLMQVQRLKQKPLATKQIQTTKQAQVTKTQKKSQATETTQSSKVSQAQSLSQKYFASQQASAVSRQKKSLSRGVATVSVVSAFLYPRPTQAKTTQRIKTQQKQKQKQIPRTINKLQKSNTSQKQEQLQGERYSLLVTGRQATQQQPVLYQNQQREKLLSKQTTQQRQEANRRRRRAFAPSFSLSSNPKKSKGKSKTGKNKNFLGNAPIEEFSGLYNRDEIIYTKGRKKSKKTGIKFKPSKLKLF